MELPDIHYQDKDAGNQHGLNEIPFQYVQGHDDQNQGNQGNLEKGAESVNLKSFKYYDRMIPAQDALPKGDLGNVIALPLQGLALKTGNSAFVDENWNAYKNQRVPGSLPDHGRDIVQYPTGVEPRSIITRFER